ncbi:MAG: ABC transporter permease [Acidobacteria bacterium]|nr:ABC transporter permease [Acidobacteriota bacterium]
METLWQDVKHGARMLGKNPAFTALVVITLGLGIGANAAVFGVLNAFILRPLPVNDPRELVVIAVAHDGNHSPHPVSYLDYRDYRQNSKAFADIAGFAVGFAGLSADNQAERIILSYVTGNYFSMLGVRPALGRLILPTEGWKPGTDPVAVISDAYWRRRFGADPEIVGKRVLVNGRPFTIVGVTPPEFHGTYAIVDFDAYLPLGMAIIDTGYREILTRRDDHAMRLLGRLERGVSIKQAESSLKVVARQLEQHYPETNRSVAPFVFPEYLARPQPNAAEQIPLVATVFMLLVGMVLMVACVNVVNLLLARATVRQKELALRAALGAGRLRLIRQLLTESLLLAGGGALAGLLVGLWVVSMLGRVQLPGDLPIRFDLSFDWRVFGYVAAVALLTGIVVGLVPAFRAVRTDLNDVLREGGRGTSDGGRHRFRNALVVGQVAVSLVLLITAGLFVRSLQNARSVDLGFDARNVLNAFMDVAQQGYDETRGRSFYRELERQARSLPGVISASLAYSAPMGYYSSAEYINVEGQAPVSDKLRPIAGYNMIGPDYFTTMRIPLVAGRAFTEHDDESSRRVAIVNEYMAHRFWPGANPIGKRFSMSGAGGPWLDIVGVSKDGKYNFIFQDKGSYFFAPIAQSYRSQRVLHLRTAVRPETLARAVQAEIRALDPNLPVFDVTTMERALEGGNGFFLLRMGALFAAALGGLGLILAVVGVYGVVSYSASRRTQEIGIRMALGADRRDILRLVVGHGLSLVAIGLAAGIAIAAGLSRFIANLLFGISSTDAVTFAVVPLVLGLMGLMACYVPAMRATHVDPMTAVRHE